MEFKFNIQQTNNIKYDNLISEGYKELQSKHISNSFVYFTKAKHLIDDPVEAHLALAIISALRHDVKKSLFDNKIDNETDKQSSDKSKLLSTLDLSIDKNEMIKILKELDKIILAPEFKNYTNIGNEEFEICYPNMDELRKFIYLFEPYKDKMKEINDFIIRLKENFIITCARTNQRDMFNTAFKYLKQIKNSSIHYSYLHINLIEQKERNDLNDLYFKDLIALNDDYFNKLIFEKFNKKPLYFAFFIRRFYLTLMKNINVKEDINDSLDQVIHNAQRKFYFIILKYLPIYIANETKIESGIINDIKLLMTLNDDYKMDLSPLLNQLEIKQNIYKKQLKIS